jgi:hypothetical protein
MRPGVKRLLFGLDEGRSGLNFDFVNGIYSGDTPTYTGAARLLPNANGAYTLSAADALPRTDLGLFLETAYTPLMQRNNGIDTGTWGKDAGLTVAADGAADVLPSVNQHKASRASGNGRVNQNVNSVVSGTRYRVKIIVEPIAPFRYPFLRMDMFTAAASLRNYVFDAQALLAGYQGAGSTGATIRARAGGKVEIVLYGLATRSGTLTFNFGVSNTEMTNDTFVAPSATGDAWSVELIEVVACDATKNIESSIITDAAPFSATTAGSLTLPLGGSAKDLTLTFDDDSQQVIPGVSGSYVLSPANIDRPLIASAVWG